MLLSLALLSLATALAGGIPALHGIIQVRAVPVVYADQHPTVILQAPDRDAAFVMECTVGEERVEHSSGVVPAGEEHRVTLPRDEAVTAASCAVMATFANGLAEGKQVELSWRYAKEEEAPPPADAAPAPSPPPPRP